MMLLLSLRSVVLITLFSIIASDDHVADYPDDQPVFSSADDDAGELNVTLTIGQALYTSVDGSLVQKVVGYNGLLGGPTLRVKPGDTLRITMENKLPEETCDTDVRELWNTFHAISETNLHVHGLFVSEEANPTFIKIRPGDSHEYVIKIPEGHQGGTHWYHPHVAGKKNMPPCCCFATAVAVAFCTIRRRIISVCDKKPIRKMRWYQTIQFDSPLVCVRVRSFHNT